MSITAIDQVKDGRTTTVTATSSLSGTVYYHWYIDGAWIDCTTTNVYTFVLEYGEQVRISVLDTDDPDFDAIANAPDGYPARRTISWVQSDDDDVAKYRIEQRQDFGDWVTLGHVAHDDTQWAYRYLTGRLTDLATYEWRVVPIDSAGNDGTHYQFDPVTIVRAPDSPNFTISFDSGTAKVTFAAA